LIDWEEWPAQNDLVGRAPWRVNLEEREFLPVTAGVVPAIHERLRG